MRKPKIGVDEVSARDIIDVAPAAARRLATFVNVYEVTRHFGGHEEGGWWYNRGNPLASVPVLPGQDPEILVATLSDAFSDRAGPPGDVSEPVYVKACDFNTYFQEG